MLEVSVDLTKHAFFEGKIVPLGDAKINIATHGFLYGTAVFSGMRAYWNEEKKRLFVFRPLRAFSPFIEFRANDGDVHSIR
jgi:branched-chain amino acid aminotransferase